MREERELLGRFLIILHCRPQLVPKLEDTIGAFEMSVVPRSLCAVDGSLYVPADKASLMHGIEEVKPPSDDSLSLGTKSDNFLPFGTDPGIPKVIIVDAMLYSRA